MKDLKSQMRDAAITRKNRLDLLERDFRNKQKLVRQYLIRGHNERQIAAELDMALGTVRMHRRDIARDEGVYESML